MSAGILSINTKGLSSVGMKVLSQVAGVSIGIDIYDLLVKKETGSIDARIAKIESARANLMEALSAIDEVKATAEEHQRELASIRATMVEVGQERDQLTAEKNLLVQMTSADREVLRKALGYPSRIQRIFIWIGTFIFGAISTWLVTFAYDESIKTALNTAWKAVFGS